MKDERVYLLHAIDSLDAIQRYTVDGRDAFLGDPKTQDAVIRNIEVIGQAVKGISEQTRSLSRPYRGGKSRACATSSSTNTSAST